MFSRRRLFVSAATLAAATLYFLSRNAEAAQGPIPGSALAVAAVAVAVVAVGVAIYALRRADAVRGDFQRFSRSMEMALDEVASRSTRDSATIGELNRMVADEIRSMAELRTTDGDKPNRTAVSQDQGVRPLRVEARQPASSADATEAFEQALVKSVSQGELQISLQPIISVSRSEAVGFEVHAHVTGDDPERSQDIRRLAEPVSGLDQAAFEQVMLRQAIEAGRRQLGSDSEKMPFHIAISEALLSNETEMQNLAELTAQHRALAKSVVLSLNAGEFELQATARENLDKLTMEGFRLALEGWEGSEDEAAAASKRGVAFAKIEADRLLDRHKTRPNDPTGPELVSALQEAGISVIATGVVRDEDAVSLIDLGVDFMEGDRFSGPRLIKAPASRRAEMAGT